MSPAVLTFLRNLNVRLGVPGPTRAAFKDCMKNSFDMRRMALAIDHSVHNGFMAFGNNAMGPAGVYAQHGD